MKWIVAAIALFILALAFNLGLLVFAIYALIAVVIIARIVTRRWSQKIVGIKKVSRTKANIGETVDVWIEVENTDQWPNTWMLIEDMVQSHAIGRSKPALEFVGD